MQMQAEKLKLAEERLTWKQEAETLRLEERVVEFTAREKHRARAAAARRGEFTEEEEEEGIAECDAIYRGESEEEAAYYTEAALGHGGCGCAGSAGAALDHDYEIVWTSWPEQLYPESYQGLGSPFRYHKTQECIDRDIAGAAQAARRGRGPETEALLEPDGIRQGWQAGWRTGMGPRRKETRPRPRPKPSRRQRLRRARRRRWPAGSRPQPQPRLRLCPKCRRRRPRRRNRGRGTFSPAGLTRPATPRAI